MLRFWARLAGCHRDGLSDQEPLREVMVLIAVGRGKNYIFQTHDTDLDQSLYLNRDVRASTALPFRYRAGC